LHNSDGGTPTTITDVNTSAPVDYEENVKNDSGNIFERLANFLQVQSAVTAEEFAAVDSTVTTAETLTDADIVQAVQKPAVVADQEQKESDDDDDDNEITSFPHSASLLDSIKTIRRFLEAQPQGDSMYNTLAELEQFIDKNLIAMAI